MGDTSDEELSPSLPASASGSGSTRRFAIEAVRSPAGGDGTTTRNAEEKTARGRDVTLLFTWEGGEKTLQVPINQDVAFVKGLISQMTGAQFSSLVLHCAGVTLIDPLSLSDIDVVVAAASKGPVQVELSVV